MNAHTLPQVIPDSYVQHSRLYGQEWSLWNQDTHGSSMNPYSPLFTELQAHDTYVNINTIVWDGEGPLGDRVPRILTQHKVMQRRQQPRWRDTFQRLAESQSGIQQGRSLKRLALSSLNAARPFISPLSPKQTYTPKGKEEAKGWQAEVERKQHGNTDRTGTDAECEHQAKSQILCCCPATENISHWMRSGRGVEKQKAFKRLLLFFPEKSSHCFIGCIHHKKLNEKAPTATSPTHICVWSSAHTVTGSVRSGVNTSDVDFSASYLWDPVKKKKHLGSTLFKL